MTGDVSSAVVVHHGGNLLTYIGAFGVIAFAIAIVSGVTTAMCFLAYVYRASSGAEEQHKRQQIALYVVRNAGFVSVICFAISLFVGSLWLVVKALESVK